MIIQVTLVQSHLTETVLKFIQSAHEYKLWTSCPGLALYLFSFSKRNDENVKTRPDSVLFYFGFTSRSDDK